MESTRRQAGWTALVGGGLWLLIWVHFLLTHGPGPDDRQGRFLALTHEDSTKLVLVPVVLVAVALLA